MGVPRVFIPHIAERWDQDAERKVPKHDFAAAALFGQLTPVLDKEDNPMFLALITPKIREALKDFNDNDSLLAAGDPSVIAICAALILRRRKTMKMLKWDKKMHTYVQLEVNP